MKLLVLATTFGLAAAGGTPMTHAAAAAKLGNAGIGISSTGGCSNKNNPQCTSLDGVLTGTIDNAVVLKGACGCTLTVTGGTETGHGTGPGKTHGNGYKLDFRKNDQLTSYVKNHFAYAGVRGDGYPMWKSDAGNIYCDEGNHWDVVYI